MTDAFESKNFLHIIDTKNFNVLSLKVDKLFSVKCVQVHVTTNLKHKNIK